MRRHSGRRGGLHLWRIGMGVAGPGLAAALALAGCDTVAPGGPPPMGPPPPLATPFREAPRGFDPAEFNWSATVGSNAVIGRVAYTAANGAIWTCSGQTVALIPRTRYSAERMRARYASDDRAVVPVELVRARDAANPGADYGRFVRTTVCDARNGFVFSHLPDGGYYVVARATPKHGGGGDGVALMQRVSVRDSAGLHITLPTMP